MYPELLKILSILSPKAKLYLFGLGIIAYLGTNGFMAYNASKNGQGFENSLLRIKITPKEQEIRMPNDATPPIQAADHAAATPAVEAVDGTVV